MIRTVRALVKDLDQLGELLCAVHDLLADGVKSTHPTDDDVVFVTANADKWAKVAAYWARLTGEHVGPEVQLEAKGGLKVRPRTSKFYGYELMDGGHLHYPEPCGAIRLTDARGNTVETRSPGDFGYEEWYDMFDGFFFEGQEVHCLSEDQQLDCDGVVVEAGKRRDDDGYFVAIPGKTGYGPRDSIWVNPSIMYAKRNERGRLI